MRGRTRLNRYRLPLPARLLGLRLGQRGRHGVEARALTRILGLVLPGDAASAQVLRKLGLRYERRLPVARFGAEADLSALQRRAA